MLFDCGLAGEQGVQAAVEPVGVDLLDGKAQQLRKCRSRPPVQHPEFTLRRYESVGDHECGHLSGDPGRPPFKLLAQQSPKTQHSPEVQRYKDVSESPRIPPTYIRQPDGYGLLGLIRCKRSDAVTRATGSDIKNSVLQRSRHLWMTHALREITPILCGEVFKAPKVRYHPLAGTALGRVVLDEFPVSNRLAARLDDGAAQEHGLSPVCIA